MNEFFKFWSIVTIVYRIIDQFAQAGGPSINPLLVANEAKKELERKVANGFLSPDVLDDHLNIIQAAIESHPDVQNIQDR